MLYVAQQGGIPESGFSEKSEFVNPEMRETLGFQFQKKRELKLWVSYRSNWLSEANLLADRFSSTNPEFLSVSSLLQSQTRCFISSFIQSVSKRIH